MPFRTRYHFAARFAVGHSHVVRLVGFDQTMRTFCIRVLPCWTQHLFPAFLTPLLYRLYAFAWTDVPTRGTHLHAATFWFSLHCFVCTFTHELTYAFTGHHAYRLFTRLLPHATPPRVRVGRSLPAVCGSSHHTVAARTLRNVSFCVAAWIAVCFAFRTPTMGGVYGTAHQTALACSAGYVRTRCAGLRTRHQERTANALCRWNDYQFATRTVGTAVSCTVWWILHISHGCVRML